MKTSETIGELAKALAAAQAEMGNVAKNKKNPFFKSNYADLAAVLSTVTPVLSNHGLSVVQFPGNAEHSVSVTTRMMHSSGEWVEDTVSCTPDKKGPQDVGKVITYLRRYALAAVCGVAQEDDDGESATDHGSKKTKPAPRSVESYENLAAGIQAAKTHKELDAIKAKLSKAKGGLPRSQVSELASMFSAKGQELDAEVAA